MCTYFKIETDLAQNLIDYFFLTLTEKTPPFEETEALHAELNERVETGIFLTILIMVTEQLY